MLIWIGMHFVEVGFLLVLVWIPGIRNADAVLADLKRFWKGLLMPEVEMLFLVWGFSSSLLEMVLFLMAEQRTPHKWVPGFGLGIRKHVHVYCQYF